MERSGTLSGANVALELLPREITCDSPSERSIAVQGSTGRPADAQAALATLSGMALSRGPLSVALGPVAALADLSAPFVAPACPSATAPGKADLAAGRLPEALGHFLMALTTLSSIDGSLVYAMALCLAGMTRSAEAYRLLSLVDCEGAASPTLLALRGYLAFQNGEADVGRKLLARAALASRGVPQNRSILHFTQHVLLVQQFGG